MHSLLAGRLRHADRWRARCASWSVERRLVALLDELIELFHAESGARDVLTLPFSQTELAELIGGSRKSVSRIRYGLRCEGVVDAARRSVSVRDPGELRRRTSQATV